MVSGTDTVYGNVINFLTAANNPAAVNTGAVTNITLTSADVAAVVTSTGTTPVTQHGIVWSKTNQNPTTTDSVSALGALAAPASYNSSLSNLSPATIYYVRAYVTNNAGTNYGNVVSFTTLSNTAPSVTSDSVISISTNSAIAKGIIINIGSSPVTQYGHVWSSVNNVPTINDSKSQLGTANAATNFNSQLIGLTASTTYFVRAYATNNTGTSYGTVITFTTGANTNALPTVTTDSIVQIDYNLNPLNSADLYGTIRDTGSSNITNWGHVWSSTNTTPTINDSKSDINGHFANILPYKFGSSPRNVLTPGTTYYVRTYAINNFGISYGNTISFTTATYSLATVSTGPAVNITFTTADIPGQIVNIGNSSVTEYGHCISATNPNPTTADLKYAQVNTINVQLFDFRSYFTNLIAGTTYYVRAYAINSAGTAYSSVTTFVTTPHNPPIITTGTISNITFTSAIAGGQIGSTGNDPSVSQYGHVWSSTNNVPTINDNKTQLGTGTTGLNFTSSLTGLTANTTYYVRAYGVNSGGISYGNVVTFSTPSVNASPVVTTGNISSITFSTANGDGNITDVGSSPITQYGLVWSDIHPNPVVGDYQSNLGTTTVTKGFTTALTGLQPGNQYWVRAYATNASGTSYGDVVNFRTFATIATFPVGNITATSANAIGAYNSGTQSSPSVTYGHVWSSTNTVPTINDSKTQFGPAGGGVASYGSPLTGLSNNTKYYVRAYAINSAGIVYSDIVTFTTGTAANYPPSVKTGFVSSISATIAFGHSDITDIGSANVTHYGHVWSSTNNAPTIADGKTDNGSATGAVSFTDPLNSLQPSTSYYIRAYAQNSFGITYGVVEVFTTDAYTLADVTTGTPFYQPGGVANAFVDFPGTINNTGNSPVTQYGHVWSKTNTTPTLSDNFNQLGSGSAGAYNSVFSPTVITPGTYYVRAYATNSAGTIYGAVKTFTY